MVSLVHTMLSCDHDVDAGLAMSRTFHVLTTFQSSLWDTRADFGILCFILQTRTREADRDCLRLVFQTPT